MSRAGDALGCPRVGPGAAVAEEHLPGRPHSPLGQRQRCWCEDRRCAWRAAVPQHPRRHREKELVEQPGPYQGTDQVPTPLTQHADRAAIRRTAEYPPRPTGHSPDSSSQRLAGRRKQFHPRRHRTGRHPRRGRVPHNRHGAVRSPKRRGEVEVKRPTQHRDRRNDTSEPAHRDRRVPLMPELDAPPAVGPRRTSPVKQDVSLRPNRLQHLTIVIGAQHRNVRMPDPPVNGGSQTRRHADIATHGSSHSSSCGEACLSDLSMHYLQERHLTNTRRPPSSDAPSTDVKPQHPNAPPPRHPTARPQTPHRRRPTRPQPASPRPQAIASAPGPVHTLTDTSHTPVAYAIAINLPAATSTPFSEYARQVPKHFRERLNSPSHRTPHTGGRTRSYSPVSAPSSEVDRRRRSRSGPAKRVAPTESHSPDCRCCPCSRCPGQARTPSARPPDGCPGAKPTGRPGVAPQKK